MALTTFDEAQGARRGRTAVQREPTVRVRRQGGKQSVAYAHHVRGNRPLSVKVATREPATRIDWRRRNDTVATVAAHGSVAAGDKARFGDGRVSPSWAMRSAAALRERRPPSGGVRINVALRAKAIFRRQQTRADSAERHRRQGHTGPCLSSPPPLRWMCCLCRGPCKTRSLSCFFAPRACGEWRWVGDKCARAALVRTPRQFGRGRE
jgi:hypothetical protein